MGELRLISQQQPGLVSIGNYQELKNALAEILLRYQNLVYTDAMLADAKKDKKELSRLRKEIDDRRKEIKRTYLAPYNEFEVQVKELIAMIDSPLDEIKSFITGMEERAKAEKKEAIRLYYLKSSSNLGDFALKLWDSPVFFDPKWLNATTSAKTWQAAVDTKIANAARDIKSIQAIGGVHEAAMVAKYLESLDASSLGAYLETLTSVSQMTGVSETYTDTCTDHRIGYKVLKLTGTSEQMIQALELLALAGVECEEVEDGMPQPMTELEQPNFDSFVAFDIETTGTYGAASGDAPAEITEIGAVKVVNGKIIERFSELVNPGRKILPRIARITHITDDMVVDKPDINLVIRKFADFVSDSILVGHNIKSSDLYYICRAAEKAGVRLENAFFDTYRYAKKFKAQQDWSKVNLGYLSEIFHVALPDAHRAWCDAEANVGVYFGLKEMN